MQAKPVHTPPPRRRPAGPTGFSLIEMLVVIGIIILIVGILFAALAKGRASADIAATNATLEAMEGMSDAYYGETGGYFDGSINTTPRFVAEIKQIADGANLLKMLGDSYDGTTVVDAWGEEILFNNPGSTTDRPWFWSKGPDKTNDSGNGNPVAGDDIGAQRNTK